MSGFTQYQAFTIGDQCGVATTTGSNNFGGPIATDVLVVAASHTNSAVPTFVTDLGFTHAPQVSIGLSYLDVWYKVADGSEGFTTINLTGPVQDWYVHAVQWHTDSLRTPNFVGTRSLTNSANPVATVTWTQDTQDLLRVYALSAISHSAAGTLTAGFLNMSGEAGGIKLSCTNNMYVHILDRITPMDPAGAEYDATQAGPAAVVDLAGLEITFSAFGGGSASIPKTRRKANLSALPHMVTRRMFDAATS